MDQCSWTVSSGSLQSSRALRVDWVRPFYQHRPDFSFCLRPGIRGGAERTSEQERYLTRVGNPSDRMRRRGSKRGWELPTGLETSNRGIPCDAPPRSWGPRNRRNYLYSDFCAERDKFLSCKCDVTSRSGGEREKRVRGARRGRRDLIATCFTTSETVMSAIEQLGGVIKIKKKN